MRRDVPRLVESIAALPGIEDLALTTNGFLFAKHAQALRDAGLRRVTFSLDSLETGNFKNDRPGWLGELLGAIDLAQQLGMNPVKVNAVVIRGLNDHEVPAMADFAGNAGW